MSSNFLEYLRSDGIVLPSEDNSHPSTLNDTDSGTFSFPSSPIGSDVEDEEPDPSTRWMNVHENIKSKITELGGSVYPKLNWSAPKDATWISATNSMECRTPNDIYLLLKSSDFITHDLEHAFDDCGSESENSDHDDASNTGKKFQSKKTQSIPYHLVLRKSIPSMTTSLEFRCFVRARCLLCICQRDLNYYPFLEGLIPTLLPLIQRFFDTNIKETFPDPSFVFDVYVPSPQKRVWLIDINPWAPRTDPLLFSWLEILDMRIEVQDHDTSQDDISQVEAETDVVEEYISNPEFRLVKRNDPEAYSFSTPQYSAHKLPKDVVDASSDGGSGLREFMGRWREIMADQQREENSEL